MSIIGIVIRIYDLAVAVIMKDETVINWFVVLSCINETRLTRHIELDTDDQIIFGITLHCLFESCIPTLRSDVLGLFP